MTEHKCYLIFECCGVALSSYVRLNPSEYTECPRCGTENPETNLEWKIPARIDLRRDA